jgi:hypothetical protein
MAILTDIFVASPTDAPKHEALQAAGRLGNLFEVVMFKGLTDLEFGTLWAIINGAEFDHDKHAFEVLTSPGETWLGRFPTPFVQKLAALNPAQIKKIAAPWAATEELQWAPAEAEEVLVELARLAKLAGSTSKGLFCWGSV